MAYIKLDVAGLPTAASLHLMFLSPAVTPAAGAAGARSSGVLSVGIGLE